MITTTPATPPSGGTPDPSGTPAPTPDPTKPNNVAALEAKIAELLAEKKQQKDRLDAVERQQREAAEAAAQAAGDWKTIAETRERELNESKQRLSTLEQQEVDRTKLAAFLQTVGGEIDRKYWGLIDLDKIVINPDTKVVDATTVANLVETFRRDHPVLVKVKSGTGQPNGAPQGGAPTITHEEWLKLPAKEMKARMNEVRGK